MYIKLKYRHVKLLKTFIVITKNSRENHRPALRTGPTTSRALWLVSPLTLGYRVDGSRSNGRQSKLAPTWTTATLHSVMTSVWRGHDDTAQRHDVGEVGRRERLEGDVAERCREVHVHLEDARSSEHHCRRSTDVELRLYRPLQQPSSTFSRRLARHRSSPPSELLSVYIYLTLTTVSVPTKFCSTVKISKYIIVG